MIKVYSLQTFDTTSQLQKHISPDEVLHHLSYLEEHPTILVQIDIETIDMRYFRNDVKYDSVFVYTYKNFYDIYFVVLTYKEDNVYHVIHVPFSVLWDFKEHNSYILKYREKIFNILFNSYERSLVNHNISFDITSLLWDWGHSFTPRDLEKNKVMLWDTQVMARIYIGDIGGGGYTLGNLSKIFLETPEWKHLLSNFTIDIKKYNKDISPIMQQYDDTNINSKEEFIQWFKDNIQKQYISIPDSLLQKLYNYIYYDGFNTYKLYEELSNRLQKESIYLYKLAESKAREMKIIIELEYNGVQINKKTMMETYYSLKQEIEEIEQQLVEQIKNLYNQLYGTPEKRHLIEKQINYRRHNKIYIPVIENFDTFNIRGDEMATMLVFVGGLWELYDKRSKKDNKISVEKAALQELYNTIVQDYSSYIQYLQKKKSRWASIQQPLTEEQKKLIQTYLHYKQIEKEYTSYYKSYLYEKIHIDPKTNMIVSYKDSLVYKDKLYPHFRMWGTTTGRLSSANPNFQNLPRKGSVKYHILPIFKHEGVVVNIDYSQVEVRINALLAQDSAMMETYLNDRDVYVDFGMKLYNVDYDTAKTKYRQAMKAVVLGLQYGLTEFGLARNLKMSLKEAKKLVDGYYQVYQGIGRFHQYLLNMMYEKGYILGGTFRRKTYDILKTIQDPYEREKFLKNHKPEIVNFPTQSAAADLCSLNFYKFYRYLVNHPDELPPDVWNFFITVHDSIVLSLKNEDKYIDKLLELTKILENDIHPLIKSYLDLLYGKGQWQSIPIKVDLELGFNYKELMSLKEFKEFTKEEKGLDN